jgi:biotin operon repressor
MCDDYKKNMKKLIREVRRQGIEVYQAGGNQHYKFVTPEGLYIAPHTPSCRYAYLKVVKGLRKRGVEV